MRIFNMQKNVVFYPTKKHSILLLFIFIWLTYEAILRGELWLAIVSALAGILSGVMLLPQSSFLLIDSSGLLVVKVFVSGKFLWSDIESWHVIQVGRHKMLGFNMSESYKNKNSKEKLEKNRYGVEKVLPIYKGISADKLLDILTHTKKNSELKPLGSKA